MQSLFIITSNKTDYDLLHWSEFFSLLSAASLKATLVRLDQLRFTCDSGISCFISEQSIEGADWIYFRRMGKRFNVMEWQAIYAAFPEKKYLTPLYVTDSRSKLVQTVTMKKAGISVPRTVYFTYGEPEERAKYVVDILGLPVVEKFCHGTEGKQVAIYRDEQSLIDGITQHGKAIREVIFQEYIPNDGDYRVVVFGNVVRAAGFRTAQKGEWRNNVNLGGSVAGVPLTDLPARVTELAEAASQAMQMPIAGVDVIQHLQTKDWYVLEVNTAPGMQTPGVAAAYADYFRETILNNDRI